MATRYTAGQARAALSRLIREMAARSSCADADPEIARLRAAHALADELDLLIDQLIVAARRRPNPLSWHRIGRALGVSGQAASQRARARQLPVQPPDHQRLIDEGRKTLGRLESRSAQ